MPQVEPLSFWERGRGEGKQVRTAFAIHTRSQGTTMNITSILARGVSCALSEVYAVLKAQIRKLLSAGSNYFPLFLPPLS